MPSSILGEIQRISHLKNESFLEISISNIIQMAQIITLLILMIASGIFVYTSKYKNQEKPKTGIKREKPSDYFKDYLNLKLYWTSIAFIVFGITILLAILILELIFN